MYDSYRTILFTQMFIHIMHKSFANQAGQTKMVRWRPHNTVICDSTSLLMLIRRNCEVSDPLNCQGLPIL